MSRPLIAKPLLTALLLTGVVSIMLTQRIDTSTDDASSDLLPDQSPMPNTVMASGASLPAVTPTPWLRKTVSVLTQAHDQKPKPLIPAPPQPPPPVMLPPPPPPQPVAPEPGFSYLGRMVDNGITTVFLTIGENVTGVAVGAKINNDWLLVGANSKSIKLRYLPLNENKELLLSPP